MAYIPYVKRSLRKTNAPIIVRRTVILTPVQAKDKAHPGTVDSFSSCISGGRKTESNEDQTDPSSSLKIIDNIASPSTNSNDSYGASQ